MSLLPATTHALRSGGFNEIPSRAVDGPEFFGPARPVFMFGPTRPVEIS